MLQSKVITIARHMDGNDTRKVAVYCRVSNQHKEHQESLENQMTHYKQLFLDCTGVELVEVYYDYGISGFKKNRPGFLRMLEDARKGKFHQIYTKSVNRFSRNTTVLLEVIRELNVYGIDVYFELQNIHTISEEGELMLTVFASIAEAQSTGGRRMTRMTIERKLKDGISNDRLSRTFGYTIFSDGSVKPDDNAYVVRMIFEMVVKGMSISAITKYLNTAGYVTQNGSAFYRATVARIIRNEEYKGDFVQQKYYVNEERRLCKNDGVLPKYYFHNHHPPIVSKVLWNKAQHIFDQDM